MVETLGQRIFRAIIATTVAALGGGAILYYGYLHYPMVRQYWLVPAAIAVIYLLYKDTKIIKGKD